jgi:hypothetical protein
VEIVAKRIAKQLHLMQLSSKWRRKDTMANAHVHVAELPKNIVHQLWQSSAINSAAWAVISEASK